MMNCCLKSGIVFLIVLLYSLVLKAQFVSIGDWDEDGRPSYLEAEGIECSLDFWERLNQALPERVSLAESQPALLENADHDLFLTDSAEVTVTFIHEGAGWKNSLFYYTYSEEPGGPEDLILKLIFPNSSLNGSGGSLSHGDQVSLGNFPSGTFIGFGLVARGWKQQTASVENDLYTLFSNPDWNPEPNSEIRQHSVLLSDPQREMVIIGFEDIRRDWQSCDHDFNDCIFGINVDPFTPEAFADLPQLSESNSPCYSVPVGLGADEIKLYKSTLSWNEIEGAEAYRVRFRKWNSNDPWEYRNAGGNTSLVLGVNNPLSASTYYEWQVAVTCDGVQTGNSIKHVFTTLSPCHMSLGHLVSIFDETSVRLHWTAVVGSENFQIRFRKEGEEDYHWRNSGSNSYIDLFDLEPGATYEWNVQTHCDPLQSCFAPYQDHYNFTMPLNFWEGELRNTISCSDRKMLWDLSLTQSWNYNLSDSEIYQFDSHFLIFEQDGLQCLVDGVQYSFMGVQNVEYAFAFAMDNQWKLVAIDQFGFRVQVFDQQGNVVNQWLGDEQWSNVTRCEDGLVLTEMNHHKIYHWNLEDDPLVLEGTYGLNGDRLLSADVSGDGQLDLLSMNKEEIHFVLNRSEQDTMSWVNTTYQVNGTFDGNEFAHQLTDDKWMLPMDNGMIQVLETSVDQLFFNAINLESEEQLFHPKFTFHQELGVALFCAWNSQGELCFGWWDFVSNALEISGNLGAVNGQRIEWLWFEDHWMISLLNLESGVSWYEVNVEWEEVITEVWRDKNEGLVKISSNLDHVWFVEGEKSIRLVLGGANTSIAKANNREAYLTLSNEGCANYWKVKVEEEPDQEHEEALYVYPNPVTHELHVQTGTNYEGLCEFEIYSSNGRAVMKGLTNAIGPEVILDVSLLSSGSYILRLTKDQISKQTNFVKVQ